MQKTLTHNSRQYIVPEITEALRREIVSWKNGPAFVVPPEYPAPFLVQGSDTNLCRNCGGNGSLLTRFCSGAARQQPIPGTREVNGETVSNISTYIEQMAGYRDGWYLVERSTWVKCQECNGFGVYAEEKQGVISHV